MKHPYLPFILLVLGYFPGSAQSTLHFTLYQPPPLLADAGPNQTIPKGQKVTLGGAVVASGGSGTYLYAWAPAVGLDRADVAHPAASPDATTVYTLTVSDPNGCNKQSQVTVTVTAVVTAARATQDPFGLRLFPNPNDGTFTLASTEQLLDSGPVRLDVYDPIGQQLYAETIQAGPQKLNRLISLPPHVQGIYFLRLTGRNVNCLFKLLVQ